MSQNPITPDEFFAARVRGEEGLYKKDTDFLYMAPKILVLGAAYAADPASEIHAMLIRQGYANPKELVRAALPVLLEVMDACRSADLTEVFAGVAGKLDAQVCNAIFMGAGAVVMREYNYLYRKYRLTRMRDNRINESTPPIDVMGCMRIFDGMLLRQAQRE